MNFNHSVFFCFCLDRRQCGGDSSVCMMSEVNFSDKTGEKVQGLSKEKKAQQQNVVSCIREQQTLSMFNSVFVRP